MENGEERGREDCRLELAKLPVVFVARGWAWRTRDGIEDVTGLKAE